ncbi:MAG TPA: hypothetical protein VN752_00740 [Solirubrobacterales bacterium]|nr:hypothetical protein [Solirubrobacterales bacterium]
MRSRALLTLTACLAACALATPAQASQAINDFTVTTSTTQAGGHPDVKMSFTLDSPGAPEAAKDVAVNTPEGLFGNPNAVPKCTSEDFAFKRCPSTSQVGLITIRANHEGNPNALLGTAPIYNREPPGAQTALFGFIVPGLEIPISIPVAVRTTTDYGLRFTVANLTQLTPLAKAELTYWGFPADEIHDPERFPKGTVGCPGKAGADCLTKPTSAGISVNPLINNPSICTGAPLAVSLDLTTYQDPGNPTHAEAAYPASTGCSAMTFKPVLLATPTSKETDAPAGFDIEMAAPQPLGRSTTPSPIKSATLTLPEGLTINPDAADGQRACLDAEAGFDSEAPHNCPDNAKIGTFEVDSPSLDGPLTGSIYLGQPKPGNQYRFFLLASGFGINAKLLGTFHPDPTTGRITALIEDLPQVSFETFDLHLFASDRGLVATPTHCSVYRVDAHFFPWNVVLADQRSEQFFELSSGPGGASCPGTTRPFSPRLAAGTSNPLAGAFSDFHLKLDRDDGDQFIGDLGFTMPPGFTGSLRGLAYCPEAAILAAAQKPGLAEQAAPSCPAQSLIGTTNVAAGPGSHPFHAQGKMYFAGPFKGAPLSLVAVTPALAGPYDYGTIVVRVAVNVDPATAQVTALSDTVPAIVGGVPIRLRSIEVNLTRPGFTLNPTNCEALAVKSQGIGDQGTVAAFSSLFNVVNCATLGFRPRMAITQLGGKKQTKRSKNPALRVDLYTRPADANIRSLSVTLPKDFAIDQGHLGNICSKAELAAKRCAGRQPIGGARVDTPLLDQPLAGPAYAVSGYGRLPRLIFILGGQVTIMPEARSASVKRGHLKTTVPVIPDAPVGHFRLDLLGGAQGYLVNTKSLCAGKAPQALVEFTGQNGKARTQKVAIKAACGKRQGTDNRRARR